MQACMKKKDDHEGCLDACSGYYSADLETLLADPDDSVEDDVGGFAERLLEECSPWIVGDDPCASDKPKAKGLPRSVVKGLGLPSRVYCCPANFISEAVEEEMNVALVKAFEEDIGAGAWNRCMQACMKKKDDHEGCLDACSGYYSEEESVGGCYTAFRPTCGRRYNTRYMRGRRMCCPNWTNGRYGYTEENNEQANELDVGVTKGSCADKRNKCLEKCISVYSATPKGLKANPDYVACRKTCRDDNPCNGSQSRARGGTGFNPQRDCHVWIARMAACAPGAVGDDCRGRTGRNVPSQCVDFVDKKKGGKKTGGKKTGGKKTGGKKKSGSKKPKKPLKCSELRNKCLDNCISEFSKIPNGLKANPDYVACRTSCKNENMCNGSQSRARGGLGYNIARDCPVMLARLAACSKGPNGADCRNRLGKAIPDYCKKADLEFELELEEQVALELEFGLELEEELDVGGLPCYKKRNICFGDCISDKTQKPASQQANDDYWKCRTNCQKVYNCNAGNKSGGRKGGKKGGKGKKKEESTTTTRTSFRGYVKKKCGDKIAELRTCTNGVTGNACRRAITQRYAPCENAARQEVRALKRKELGLIHEEDSVGASTGSVGGHNWLLLAFFMSIALAGGYFMGNRSKASGQYIRMNDNEIELTQ